jgi:hypothetical protein
VKTCSKCGIEKELDMFPKRGARCKACKRACDKQWEIKNKEQLKHKRKLYRIKNKNEIKEYNKQYRIKNKGSILEYHKQYRAKK